MSTQAKRRYSLEEYFELERTSEERWEYFNGEVFCMSGVSRNHGELEINLIATLDAKLRGRGCHVYPANIRIKVPAAPPYRYPDLSVLGDEPVFEKIGGVDALTNPVVIVEILSPSTEAYDRGDKFTYYKSISSLREYVLVAQHRPHITHYVKEGGEKWKYEELNELGSELALPSIDCVLALSEVYRNVTFEPLTLRSPEDEPR
jgi:Uma2 family endonuclease